MPSSVLSMQENPVMALAGFFGLNTMAQTMCSINAFEITYNGHKLHSKIKTGTFPDPMQVVPELMAIKAQEMMEDVMDSVQPPKAELEM